MRMLRLSCRHSLLCCLYLLSTQAIHQQLLAPCFSSHPATFFRVLLLSKGPHSPLPVARSPPPFSFYKPTRTSARTIKLDRLRAFKRRRRDSPSLSPDSLSADDTPTPRDKSPGWLSKMHRNRSTSQRSASPTAVAEDIPSLPRTDGSFGTADESGGEIQPEAPKAPELPSFLKLTEAATRIKYMELNRLENERLFSSQGEFPRRMPDAVLDRYNNIFPWDNNRVKLKVLEGFNDYINASPVTLTSISEKEGAAKSGVRDKYICMQGPKKQTVDHVWHMVWHEVAVPYNSSPAVIIMLSPTHSPDELGKSYEKCYQYYPLDENSPPLKINEKGDLGDEFKAEVRFVSREPGIEGTAIEVRKLMMKVEGQDEEKPIWHYLYPDWPDFGALEEDNAASLLALMDVSRKQNGEGENPRIVHCSAGVGRTGTFIALEFLIGELRSSAWEDWDQTAKSNSDPVYDAVNQLRTQRKTMVQSYEQYAFLYEVLRKVWGGEYGPESAEVEHSQIIDVVAGKLDD